MKWFDSEKNCAGSSVNKKNKKSNAYYPIFINIQSKPCVVIGGGAVALRKINNLLECRAKVTVISPTVHSEISQLSGERIIRLVERNYKTGDLKNAMIAIICTDSKKVNRKAADEARKAGVLVNVSDDPERSDFIVPSFFRRGDLTIAVSTSGVSPALAKKIRTKLEEIFGEEYASLLSLLGEVRSKIKKEGNIVEPETWQELVDMDLLMKLLKTGSRDKAKTFLLKKLRGTFSKAFV